MATSTKPSSRTKNARQSGGQAASGANALLSDITTKRFWRNSAPKGILEHDQWTVWSRHLKKRPAPLPIAALCKSDSTPLVWGLNLQELSPRTVELLALLEQLGAKSSQGKLRVSGENIEQILGGWLEGSHALPQSVDYALECLVVAHTLPKISEAVSPDFWWSLLDALLKIAKSAAQWRSDAELPPEQGLAQQLLAGELPLTLAYLFPEIRLVSKLRGAAHEALSEGLLELTNGNGLVQAEYLGYHRPLLACWTRCRLLGDQLKKGCWSGKANKQFQWAVTHAIGLSSSQGAPMLGQPHSEPWTADFLRTALQVGGEESDALAAKLILTKKLGAKLVADDGDEVPATSDNCEWAGLAYMRADWQRKEPALVVDYSSPDLRLECWSGAQQLLAGTWSWETTLDGERLEPQGTWDETCWFSDIDVDYLELSMELSDGALLERQILLARDEMFLLLADYVLDTRGGQLNHRYRLPLSGEIDFQPEQETREGHLIAGKTLARVLPLALPEWRNDPRIGQLTADKGRLQLEQQRNGKNLACPLLIDLDSKRAKKECTWRQLTIAQALEVQSHDVAVGYRAQCGGDQWLIYRSLAEAANRTLLGQNLSNECLVARFLAPEGEIDELLEIE